MGALNRGLLKITLKYFAGHDARQQRLSAWTPVMTPLTYIALFASVGVGFVVVGGLLMADGAVL